MNEGYRVYHTGSEVRFCCLLFQLCHRHGAALNAPAHRRDCIYWYQKQSAKNLVGKKNEQNVKNNQGKVTFDTQKYDLGKAASFVYQAQSGASIP